VTQLSICDVCSVGQDTTWDERQKLHICQSCLHMEVEPRWVPPPTLDPGMRCTLCDEIVIAFNYEQQAQAQLDHEAICVSALGEDA